jgi:uncharacterized protein YprB with RNaseH-like and TPR domain
MRDLAARLRDVVRRERARETGEGDDRPVLRELTYVPDPDASAAPAGVAAGLGGEALGGSEACVVIDRRYAADASHGRHRIESCVPRADAPIHLFDARVTADHAAWWRKVVFFDIETTGLSGGAGTIAFLAGCGWFDEAGHFLVRQFFLAAPSGERPMLDALRDVFAEASLLVTYNGRTFDVPFMEMRWAFHRAAAPTDDLPHFDMLPPARRLWSRREMASPEGEGCSLSALERRVLGFHRLGDVPGFEIPARYFQFLRTGEASLIEGVLEHNRHDLVSLAAVMSHALWLAQEGPEACREPAEQVALGRIYERGGQEDAAVRSYEMAEATGDAEVRRHALARMAVIHRRASRHDAAASAWQTILDLVPRGRRALGPLERRAAEALAIHHEHRAKNLGEARRYAEALSGTSTGRQGDDVERRLRRLQRKMGRLLD